MDFSEKAKIRLEHWVAHDQGHLTEYKAFAQELSDAGLAQSAEAISDLAGCVEKGIACMQRALASLDSGGDV
ncbi:MAG: hypothetical protein PVG03_06000 [Desulfarculaceae bacterium]|jgi:hypothetical protein